MIAYTEAEEGTEDHLLALLLVHGGLRIDEYQRLRSGERILKVEDRAAGKRVRKWQRKIGAAVYGPHRIRHSVLTHMAMSSSR